MFLYWWIDILVGCWQQTLQYVDKQQPFGFFWFCTCVFMDGSKTVPLGSALVLSHAEHEEALEVRCHTFQLLAVLHLIMSNFCNMSVFYLFPPQKLNKSLMIQYMKQLTKSQSCKSFFSSKVQGIFSGFASWVTILYVYYCCMFTGGYDDQKCLFISTMCVRVKWPKVYKDTAIFKK